MSNVFNKGDRVTVRGLNGTVAYLGLLGDFQIDLDDDKKIWVLGKDPKSSVVGLKAVEGATRADVAKLPNTTAPTTTAPTTTAPTTSVPPPRPSAPTVTGPIPGRPIAAASSFFKLTSRPVGRRSYDIDTGATPAAGSTTIPPPISRSTDSTLSFLTPRKKSCAGAVAGVV
jgi:hypothetical protein